MKFIAESKDGLKQDPETVDQWIRSSQKWRQVEEVSGLKEKRWKIDMSQLLHVYHDACQVKKHKKHKKSKKREREDGGGEEEEVKRSKKDFKEDSIKHGGW